MRAGTAHNGIPRLVLPVQGVEETAGEERLYRFAALRWPFLGWLRLNHGQATLPPWEAAHGNKVQTRLAGLKSVGNGAGIAGGDHRREIFPGYSEYVPMF